jgi:hypothetical protein
MIIYFAGNCGVTAKKGRERELFLISHFIARLLSYYSHSEGKPEYISFKLWTKIK